MAHVGMFFNRGSKLDYDAWEKLGNPGWSWDDLLPYFKKVCCLPAASPCSTDPLQSETFNPPSDEIAAAFPGVISEDLAPHGTNGPVDSSFSNFQYPVIRESSSSPITFFTIASRPWLTSLDQIISSADGTSSV